MKETILEKLPRILGSTLDKTKKYVAAVSGGADSLALADGLYQAGFHFTVCHVEHGIRGEESLEDARFVEAFCKQRDIPFCCKQVRVPELKEKEKLSMEDAARRLRYQALNRCAVETGADFILTAHQKDDQAETFLLRLLRGSGTRGLGAIRFRRGRILRPLLPFSAEELRSYCDKRGITWRKDSTNEDIRYARNRIRKLVMPLLKEHFSPVVTDVLCRTAEHLQEDSLFLEEAAANELKKRLLAEKRGGWAIRTDGWETVPPALRFRILQQFWQQAGGNRELSGANLGDMEQLVENHSSGKKILLPGSWQALCSYDKLLLFSSEDWQHLQDKYEWSQVICWGEILSESDEARRNCTEVLFPDGRTALLSIMEEMPAYTYRAQMVYPLDDLKKLGNCLEFRFRKPGDRIYPLKGTGHKSLK
ncbi:MAG: tRNA lysidine(34) synthetase TilS, partial [Acidaminococcaceae bacterium]|nr:tRNA lysidine(34) synthetase TilS [Acidaminococcaceae bacterium]